MIENSNELNDLIISDEWKEYSLDLVDIISFAQNNIAEALSLIHGRSSSINFCRFHLDSAYNTLEKALHYIED